MTDEAEILWRMCNENYTQARQHETLRERMTGFFSGIAAASLAFAGQGGLHRDDLPLAIMLIVLGAFGAVFSIKHYERFEFHVQRARGYREKLQQLLPGAQLAEIRRQSGEKHKARYPRLHRLKLYHFWLGLHIVIALIGIVVTCLILIQ